MLKVTLSLKLWTDKKVLGKYHFTTDFMALVNTDQILWHVYKNEIFKELAILANSFS